MMAGSAASFYYRVDAEHGSIEFAALPSFNAQRLVGMVASHHGGKLDVFDIPLTRAQNARLVVSTGTNSYRHPNAQMLENFKLRGWVDQVRTDAPGVCFDESCAHSVGASVVQPEWFEKPRCQCFGIPEARMSIAHSTGLVV